ncbi:site-specific integrase [Paenibacillus polygoni]|uniref:Site-specific integrase n=1 Tax=Paenibacillus polygoni TaxID=3050112 RepID=A0ABY8X3I5_9BACL|nr:site-specific integrase [Paenibacillus polygoni]WIV19729.1 site-specific integrase [Paenibacillus polygoni]
MSVFRNEDNGTWYAMVRYDDWTGKRKQKMKRGFRTKREALAWEREFLLEKQADLDMTFESFYERYKADVIPKIKHNTWLTKQHIIETKILPYFKGRKISEITPADIIAWQNKMRVQPDRYGKPHSKTYLKTIHNQLSAIFNHAYRYYGLKVNPARRAGNMGSEETGEMLFWTKEEYLKFSDAMMDKDLSFYAFELLYWTGIRVGELLALTPSDFDLENRKLHITKSYQRLEGKDIITTPKTKKSNRTIILPQFLADEIGDYISSFYSIEPDTRLFPVTKNFLYHEMKRGCKETGVKKIRVHDLRHSHVSLLIHMGYSALAIGARVGHEAENITYRYAHLFPTVQTEMAEDLNVERSNNYVGEKPGQKR